MTPACTVVALTISLGLYLAAALLFQAHLLFQRTRLGRWARRILATGLTIHACGMALHIAFSGSWAVIHVPVVTSLLTIALLAGALLAERFLGIQHLLVVASPLGFVALLYALLMPLRFQDAEYLLIRYPWVGIHVALSLLGYAGFAVAFCGAVAYLAQHRALKQGRLNRYLPSLNAAADLTFHFAAFGFWLFSIGLVMGLIWMFGAPGDYVELRDAKIWAALPIWVIFAVYLYRRAVARQHGRRLKWLVIAGFLLALANLLGVRHQFRTSAAAATVPASVTAAADPAAAP